MYRCVYPRPRYQENNKDAQRAAGTFDINITSVITIWYRIHAATQEKGEITMTFPDMYASTMRHEIIQLKDDSYMSYIVHIAKV